MLKPSLNDRCVCLLQTPTLATIFTRVYEMKYLSGVLVGNQMIAEGSTNHLVGVLGTYPIPQIYRHVNAFIRGCVEADPLCRVAVLWTKTWNDAYIERSAGTWARAAGAASVQFPYVVLCCHTPRTAHSAETLGRRRGKGCLAE